MTPDSALLEVKNLEIAVGNLRLVRGLTLGVKRGSFTALVGESGSGKSISVLSWTGLLSGDFSVRGQALYRPASGQGVDLLGLSGEALRTIRGKSVAYVFQDAAASLNPVFRIGEQLAETYRAHFGETAPGARQKSLEALRLAELTDPERVFGSYPHELSGGMRQRAMIAMALLGEPELLIADEPTTALDVQTEKSVMDLLARLQASGRLSVLLVTHNLPMACAYADTVFVMRRGELAERMDKREGVFVPAGEYAKKLFEVRLSDKTPKTLIPV